MRYSARPRSRRLPLWSVAAVLALAVVGAVGYLLWRQTVPLPQVAGATPKLLGRRTPLVVTVEARGGQVASAELRLVQAGRTLVLAQKDGAALGRRTELTASLEAVGNVREGPATLEVWTRDTWWRPLTPMRAAVLQRPVVIDLTPPKLEILGATRYVTTGGAGLVAFRAGDAVRAHATVGDRTFASFPAAAAGGGQPARVALFALPHDTAPGVPLTVVAEDEAGNRATRAVPAIVKPGRFRTDTIELKDAFMREKVAELLPQHPPGRPILEGFLAINRDQRREAEDKKRAFATETSPTPLWKGRFVQPANTKVFANFAEARTYHYGGAEVDRQVHFGFDLASTREAPVPAANSGRVVFAGLLTIYGNTVVLDHGWGIMTLYAHLSSIAVKPGDRVELATELGRTGASGLAIGDHLHYEVLVGGVSVSPLEWWDLDWMRDRLSLPLKQAGLPELEGVPAREAAADGAAPPDAPRPPRRRAR